MPSRATSARSMGWSYRDQVRIVSAHAAFIAWDDLWRVVWFLSRRRVGIRSFDWSWNLLLWLAPHAYLYGDWKRCDMPQKGEAWR